MKEQPHLRLFGQVVLGLAGGEHRGRAEPL